MRFRYNTKNKWFKGNTHIHSKASDGGKTFLQLARMYAKVGYHFLCRTDHWAASNTEADSTTYPLLWLDGIELDGQDQHGGAYHIVCLGKLDGLKPEMGLVAAIESARKQGAIVVLAHPYWMHNSAEDCLRWGFDGVEIYNHVTRWLNGKSDGMVHWNIMLKNNPETLGFAADDTHLSAEHPTWNGGWIVVNAPECSRDEITKAIRKGNYYSSCGPEFHNIEFDGASVSVETSPVRFVRLVGPAWCGERLGSPRGKLIARATMKVPADWDYVYLEIEDNNGRRAWTNTLFTVRV